MKKPKKMYCNTSPQSRNCKAMYVRLHEEGMYLPELHYKSKKHKSLRDMSEAIVELNNNDITKHIEYTNSANYYLQNIL